MARIAFLGTGVMGVGMARQLIAAGHDLSVFNRTVEKTRPLVEQGARLAITPREAADGADVVFAIGTRLHEPQLYWGIDDGLKIIRLDIDPKEFGRYEPPTVALYGDARATLS